MKRKFYGFMFYNEKLPIVFFILIIFAFRSVYSSDLQQKHSGSWCSLTLSFVSIESFN